MPPGSKKSSASSNSTGTMRNIAAVRVETIAATPASEMLTSTPLTVASPSTRASAAGVAKRRRVRGPTRGKRIRRIIVENKGERISAYVTPEMRAFCGMNANKAVSELGTQIRWICPIQGFYPSWNNVDSTLKDAILQAIRSHKNAGKLNREVVCCGHTTGSRSFATVMTIAADRSGGIGNEGNDDDGNGNEPNSNEGNGNEGKKKFDLCDLYEASHRLRDTNEWIDPKCQEKHVMMVDAAALSGTPLSAEEISIKYLGESKTKNYIRGFGNGPMPSTYLSKSNSQSTLQDQLQKLQHELDLFREEQRREREEEKTRREEEQKQRKEEQRRHEEEREEEKRRWEETRRRQDEERSILLKEMDVFKSFMSQFKNGGRGNMGAG